MGESMEDIVNDICDAAPMMFLAGLIHTYKDPKELTKYIKDLPDNVIGDCACVPPFGAEYHRRLGNIKDWHIIKISEDGIDYSYEPAYPMPFIKMDFNLKEEK